MIPLKNEENQSYRKQNVCYICKKEFGIDDGIKKNIIKFCDHCYYTGKYGRTAHNFCKLRYKTPK